MAAIGRWVYTFHADNGLEVRVRQLYPDDVPHLLDIFDKMTAGSRYMRFNQPLIDPDPEWVQRQAKQLADIAPEASRGWLAFADLPDDADVPVGGIRCLRVCEGVAEVSLVVRDDLHGLGIGSNLLAYACREADAHGCRRVIGVVQGYNRQLWSSLKRLGVPTRAQRDGSLVIIEANLEGLDLERSEPQTKSDEL